MSGRESTGSDQTISVEPPVHVETFPTHDTLTWKACPLAGFVGHVMDIDGISPTASTVVDDTSTAGRERCRVADLEASETVRYLRVEPDAPWRLSWERRTWPVVSVSGTPPPTLCRRLHQRTTDCDGWPDDAVRTLARVLSDR
jgi:hypothetical protein